ncbi:hypothetical protein DFH08DRAFT_828477 [Mycena albidolilacea]|uniref:Uncharacterized protein n=1 Tax=Mycena albidolilacea TaxID=1033008 RepID=A0AAD6YWI2_9AGAR|nr:hypothetical protein DFH08DRAFT_828477 [Mycena albidolilacea]
MEVEEGGDTTNNLIDSQTPNATPLRAIGDVVAQFAEFALHMSQPFPGETESQTEKRFLIYQSETAAYLRFRSLMLGAFPSPDNLVHNVGGIGGVVVGGHGSRLGMMVVGRERRHLQSGQLFPRHAGKRCRNSHELTDESENESVAVNTSPYATGIPTLRPPSGEIVAQSVRGEAHSHLKWGFDIHRGVSVGGLGEQGDDADELETIDSDLRDINTQERPIDSMVGTGIH